MCAEQETRKRSLCNSAARRIPMGQLCIARLKRSAACPICDDHMRHREHSPQLSERPVYCTRQDSTGDQWSCSSRGIEEPARPEGIRVAPSRVHIQALACLRWGGANHELETRACYIRRRSPAWVSIRLPARVLSDAC